MKVVLLDDWENSSANNLAISELKKHFNVVVYHDKPAKTELVERLQDANIIIPIRERTKFTKEILESLKNLKLIAQTGSGVAHIDMEVAKEMGIDISTTVGGSSSVVQLIFGYILSFSRNLQDLNKEVKQGEWPESFGIGLDKKSIGIIGMGKIGLGVANVAKAFGMNVVGYSPSLTTEKADQLGISKSSLDQLLEQSDFITVNVRKTPETINLITARHFDLMKRNAFFINTSRGDIVDEQALIEALQNKKIAGAGLDVFMKEPIDPSNPLTQMNNVILTPHIGWKTDYIMESFLNASVENIVSYFIHKNPQNLK